ncbi:hypothetical protein GCM10027286_16020 [Virgibacillus ainsalahensis]
MAKYSYEFKLMVVKEYLEVPLGYTLLARKYDISDTKSIRILMNSYKAFGEESLRRKRSIKKIILFNLIRCIKL